MLTTTKLTSKSRNAGRTGNRAETPPPSNSASVAAAPSAAGRTKEIEFALEMPQARSAALAGSFNGWDPGKTPLRKDASAWKAKVPLPPGRHEYRFVVDGQWISDPKAKESVSNSFGTTNSVVVVS